MAQVETYEQRWFGGNEDESKGKEAELANTWAMPAQSSGDKSPQVHKKKTTIQKTGGFLESLFKGAEATLPDDNLKDAVSGEMPEKMPQMKPLKPHIDVSGKEPPKEVKEKKASLYALPSHEMYPLDSYVQVQRAVDYFGEYQGHLDPEQRHEFCSNLVKRASALGIDTGPTIEKYGSSMYARDPEFNAAMDARRVMLLEDNGDVEVLDKLASQRPFVDPGVFALALSDFDKRTGLVHQYDRGLPDPYWSTFGTEKTAAAGDTFVVGNDIITFEDLQRYAQGRSKDIIRQFGEEFSAEFRKDPAGIFNSLPVDQKKAIIRMATDNSPK